MRQLARRAFRRREGRLAIEGLRLVEDALAAGTVPAYALTTRAFTAADADAGRKLLGELDERGVPLFEVPAGLFAEVAGTVTPQGILAVVPVPSLPLLDPVDLLLILDGWRDPGNLGTALRTALAAGVDGVLLGPGNVDVTNPKVVRAAMGAHFRLAIQQLDWPTIGHLTTGLATWIADAGGEVDYASIDWRASSALIVGSEAHGPSPAALALGRTVRVPMAGPAESLNAATAAAVVVFEAARQRRGGG